MRILHVSESLDPAHGGTPAVPKLLGAAQAALGHAVTILTRDEPARADAIRESMEAIPGAGAIRIETVPREGGVGSVVSAGARRWAGEAAGSFDFAHLHSMWSPIPHGAARGLARAGVPYCVCPHGMLDAWSMRQSRQRKRLHLALVSRRTMARAAFVHALNEHEAACVRAFGFGPPAEVLGNGINPEMLDAMPAPGAFRERYPELGDDPFVLFLSRLHHKKGLDLLVPAFARVAAGDPIAPGSWSSGPTAGRRRGSSGRSRRRGSAIACC
jgi:glycosyltransferase involved in cell wall biosynthesis